MRSLNREMVEAKGRLKNDVMSSIILFFYNDQIKMNETGRTSSMQGRE
jgi:hypothetical protein